jgi:hypothetical protein
MTLLTNKRVLVSKIEVTYGTDPVPTGAANAMLISAPTVTPMEATMVARANIKPYLGNDPQILAAIYSKLDFEVELAGTATPGTAPPWGPQMRACGFSETLLAAAQTGTAAAGSTTTITLAAGASAVDSTYNGMTIRTIAGTGPGQWAVIKSYVGATKVATLTTTLAVAPDATTTYSIDAQAIYRPISAAFESITHYFNVDGVMHKMLGARGSVSLSMAALALPKLKFTYQGLFVPVADAAAPVPVFSAFQTPLAVNNENTVRPVVMGYASSILSDLSIDMANVVNFNSYIGSEDVQITDRKPSGSITQRATTVAQKDWWTAIQSVALGAFSITHGTVAGNRVKVDAPAMQIMTPTYSDKNGIQMLQTKADFIPDVGNDEVVFCVF